MAKYLISLVVVLATLVIFLRITAPAKSPVEASHVEAPPVRAVITQKARSTTPQASYLDLIPDLVDREEIPHQLEKRVKRYTNGTVDLVAATQRSEAFYQSPYTQDDLAIVQELLQHYRFLYQSNPVGSENAEFTAALLGANPKKVVFISPTSLALSRSFELIDRWGTPFFFHPESASSLTLTSAGPDRKLWTADDISDRLE